MTVLGAIEVTTGAWVSRLGRAEELRGQHRRHLARPTETDPRLLRNRSPGQMLDAAAPWTSPWLPPRYEQNFWNAA